TLDDLGLRIDKAGENGQQTEAILNSSTTYINDAIARAADQAGAALHIPLRQVSTYLINHVTRLADGEESRKLHYCMIAGLSDLPGFVLKDDEIAVNEWAAGQLGLKAGDRLALEYFMRAVNGDLLEVTAGNSFRVAAILPLTG